jgi:signal transduction histidine kinase
MRRSLVNRGDYEIEYRALLPDNSMRWLIGRGRAEFDHDGRPVRVRGASIDITERRLAEEAARDLTKRLINAQEDERSRLARELHDDVTQRLALLAIHAAREERGMPASAGRVAMRAMHEGLVQLSEDVHALSYRLHPAILEDLGLVEALNTEFEHFSRSESISAKLNAKNVPDLLPGAVALCLFRVAQEALQNVARHAEATQVDVSLWGMDGGLQLAVRDDGTGFDPMQHRSRPSLGIANMRERINQLGGEFDIESAPGHGTTVLGWVPLKEESRESPARLAS